MLPLGLAPAPLREVTGAAAMLPREEAIEQGSCRLRLSFVQPVDQPAHHPGDGLQFRAQGGVAGVVEQVAAAGKLQKRLALLRGTPRDAEEVPAVSFGETAVAFGQIRSDGKCRAVELIGKEVVSAREGFAEGGGVIGKVDGFLVDEEILEHEGHVWPPETV